MARNRVAVFIDGANFFYMQKYDLGWFVDPKRFLDYIDETIGPIEDAFYYIGQNVPPEPKELSYQNALVRMGYAVRTKRIKDYTNQETGEHFRKANLDIELAVDMFNLVDHYETCVLLSGDGDFERPLDILRSRGKSIKLFSTEQFAARELRELLGRHFIDFHWIRDEVEKLPYNGGSHRDRDQEEDYQD